MTSRVATNREPFAEMRTLVPHYLQFRFQDEVLLGEEDSKYFEVLSDTIRFDFPLRGLSELSYAFDSAKEETTLTSDNYILRLRPIAAEKIQKVNQLFEAGVCTSSRDGKHDVSHEGTLLNRYNEKTIQVYVTRPCRITKYASVFDAAIRTYNDGQKRIETSYALYHLDEICIHPPSCNLRNKF